MSDRVKILEVKAGEGGRKVLSYLKGLLPLPYTALQKMMRTGQVRLNGKRVKGTEILHPGDQLRLPPFEERRAEKGFVPSPSQNEIDLLKAHILYEDEDLLVLNKPFGLAVQGGSGTTKHLDQMIQVFAQEEPLRLTHRLDKDTSGVLVFAKNYGAARAITTLFKEGAVTKEYIAVAVGRVTPPKGVIEAAISKRPGKGGERMELDAAGLAAVTYYEALKEGDGLTLLKLKPKTGRTHQLRVHCADVLKTPILGDGKYGGKRAHPRGRELLHLHALSLQFSFKEKVFSFEAPLSDHMKKTLEHF